MDYGKALLADERNYYNPTFIAKSTEEESRKINDLTSTYLTIRDEYLMKFVLGELDIADDAIWNEFVTKVGEYGYTEHMELMQEIYERDNG